MNPQLTFQNEENQCWLEEHKKNITPVLQELLRETNDLTYIFDEPSDENKYVMGARITAVKDKSKWSSQHTQWWFGYSDASLLEWLEKNPIISLNDLRSRVVTSPNRQEVDYFLEKGWNGVSERLFRSIHDLEKKLKAVRRNHYTLCLEELQAATIGIQKFLDIPSLMNQSCIFSYITKGKTDGHLDAVKTFLTGKARTPSLLLWMHKVLS
jgi:hypothetical protein